MSNFRKEGRKNDSKFKTNNSSNPYHQCRLHHCVIKHNLIKCFEKKIKDFSLIFVSLHYVIVSVKYIACPRPEIK